MRLACLRVTSHTRALVDDSESAEGADLDAVIFSQAISNLNQHIFQKRCTILQGKATFYPEDLDKIGACEGLARLEVSPFPPRILPSTTVLLP